MCQDHEMLPLPDWVKDMVMPIRCLPALGVHERCEHDPDYREPTFQEVQWT